MKKISEKLGIDLSQSSIVATFGGAAQGKSTLMACFIKELHDNSKNVSIISDDSDSLWMARLKNVGCDSNGAKIIYKSLKSGLTMVDLITFIKKQKEAFPFIECFIVDIYTSYDKNKWHELVEYIRSNNMMLFTTQHKSGDGKNVFNKLINIHNGLEKVTSSDIVLSLTRTKEPKLSLWKRFLNFFRPWFGLDKFVPTNTELSVMKNRYGSDGKTVDVSIDFSKINAKK